MNNKINLILCGLLLLSFSIGCSMVKDSKAAEPAVQKFHEQFNAGKFAEIYAESGQMMKDSATEQQLTELFDAVRRKLGTYKSSTAVNWHVNSGPLSSHVTLVYDTEFSEGKGREQFLFSVKGSDVRLEGYHINSNDLITK